MAPRVPFCDSCLPDPATSRPPIPFALVGVATRRARRTNLRGLPCPDDPGTRLHALASLTDQIHTTLAAAIHQARHHNYDWDEIADEPSVGRPRLTRSGARGARSRAEGTEFVDRPHDERDPRWDARDAEFVSRRA
jgi:hypothetical protein